MGRKKLNLTDEERILRKKEQMRKVYLKQKMLKKKAVENLTPRQLKRKRKRKSVENLNHDQFERLRVRRRVEKIKPELLEILQDKREIEDLRPEQLELKKKLTMKYLENRSKRPTALTDSCIFIKEEKTDEAESENVCYPEEENAEKESVAKIVDKQEQEDDSQYYYNGRLTHVKREIKGFISEDETSICIKKKNEDEMEPESMSNPDSLTEEEESTSEEYELTGIPDPFLKLYEISQHALKSKMDAESKMQPQFNKKTKDRPQCSYKVD